MKPKDTVTVIVTRNYGRPHTLSLATWKVYAGGIAAAALAGVLIVLGLGFLVLLPYYQQVRRDLKELERERDALRQQVLSLNQERYHAKERGGAEEEPQGPDHKQQDVVPAALSAAEAYAPPVRIAALNARLARSHLEFSFQLVSTDKGRGNRGGFLFTVFENQDQTPPRFSTSPAASLNDMGFPQFYKEGLIFPPIRDSIGIRRSIRLESPDAYYTHVTIYLFSPRGGLIAKERFQLDRSVFRQDASGESRKPSKA